MKQIFMMPAGQAQDAFNTTSFVKGAAVSNYGTANDDNLADFKTVLAALAVPGLAGINRAALYPRDMENYLTEAPTAYDRKPYDIVEGIDTDHGLGFSVAKVAGPGGKAELLFALEDQKRAQIIVVGSATIDEDFKASLAKNGLTYVVRTDADAAQEVNEFIVAGARWRGEHGQMDYDTACNLVSDAAKAIAVVCDLSFISPQKPGEAPVIPKDVTIGKLLTGASDPGVCTNIRKPKRPAFENLPP